VGERVLAEGRRPSRRFRDLRETLGLPRPGQRVRAKDGRGVWKVIEEREQWRERPGGQPPEPVIRLRLWRPGQGQPPGTGPTRTELFTPAGPPFAAGWEILYD
jgi:hypothetical protein